MKIDSAIARHLDARDFDAAVHAIMSTYGAEIYGYLSVLTVEPDQALAAFATELSRGLAGFRRESSLRTWLYRIAWFALQRPPSAFVLPVALRGMVRGITPLQATAKIVALREQLQRSEQSILTLRVDRRLSWREVAEVMASDGESIDEELAARRFDEICMKLRRLSMQGLV